MNRFMHYKNAVSRIDSDSNTALIGIHHLNGLLKESDDNAGLFYLLDEYLYNYLADIFSEEINLKVKTFDTYSSIIFQCEPAKINQHLTLLNDSLIGFSIDEAYLEDIRDSAISKCCDYTKDIYDYCRYVRFHSNRFLYGIGGTTKGLSSIGIKDLLSAFQVYYTQDNRFFTLVYPNQNSLDPVAGFFTENFEHSIVNHPYPLKFHSGVFQEFHCDNTQNTNIIAIPLEDSENNLFAIELFCKIIEHKSKQHRFTNCIIDRVLFFMDYGNHVITFKVYEKGVPVQNILSVVSEIINCEINEFDLVCAKKELIRSYESLLTDPLDFSTFAAWNYSINNQYKIEQFSSLQIITSEIDLQIIKGIQKGIRLNHASGISIR